MRCVFVEYGPCVAWCTKFDVECGYDDRGQDPHDPDRAECDDYQATEQPKEDSP